MRAYSFKDESGFNYEEYVGKLRTIFHKLNKVGAPLRLEEEESYLLNGINEGKYKTNIENITTNTDRIVMSVDAESAGVHLSNFLPE